MGQPLLNVPLRHVFATEPTRQLPPLNHCHCGVKGRHGFHRSGDAKPLNEVRWNLYAVRPNRGSYPLDGAIGSVQVLGFVDR
jgi:hypothetical protein